MGNTIQYYGRAEDPEAVGRVVIAAEAFFDRLRWPYELVDGAEFTIWLDCGKDGMTYFTATGFGVIAHPHPLCEPVPLVFRPDGRLAGCVKTQFAPMSIHKDIAALLRTVGPDLAEFEVSDETGYWDSESDDGLAVAMEVESDRIMEQMATGRFVGPIVQPNGRIVDLQLKTSASAPAGAGKKQGWIGSVFTKLRKTA